jgi:ubiquinone biosynthesis protein
MRQQIGPQAAWRAIKEKAPFWAEKLPDMPDLIYDTLTQVQHQQHMVKGLYQQYHQQHRRHAQSRYLLGIGAALLLGSIILLPTHEQLATAGLTISVICWFNGWWKISRR